ncbi:tetratricopeptide repeat protein [Kitasatospora sp. SolWspMP-SS2h]|uniref:tetratricopeptide repeat protein n=1 Tax=Kitasatospora sp. SolWspMP-SS2h TaxID=1305729 RepID=UPI000DB9023E|nr:tetratricopeptide repeat protein [Kitasatospora sp. SolWspMP-SS2h]RAJ41820.1 tetratricopeptide repeat protein [Kitasatospora sp. SolWspMP-SS2h]
MLDTTDAVRAALRANDELPHGRPRTVTAEELVDAAEQFDDPQLLAFALLELTEAYEYDAEQRKLPVVFARIAKLRKEHPDSFGDWENHATDWRYKWVAAALLSVPDVPLEAVRRWHGELRAHYLARGHDLQPYYARQYRLAAHTGQGVQDAFELWAGRWRSRYSDCHACELREQARHFVALGEDERALEIWQPVFSGERSCSEEPHVSRALALLPLLRTGRLDQARSAHLTGYRWARGRSAAAEPIGLHLEFCVLTRNEPRGLEILAENRDLFDRHGDPLSRLHFLTGAQLLLSRLVEDGHGDVPVAGPPGAHRTAAALHAELRTEGDALAARYDARNGTDAVGAARRARLARTPLFAEPLPLGLRATGPAPAAPPPAPAATDRATAEPAAGTAPDGPAELAELVAKARELSVTNHPDAILHWNRIGALIKAPDHRHPEDAERSGLGSLAQLRAELALERAFEERTSDEEAAALYAGAAELFEQAGLTARALGCRARLAGPTGDHPGDLAVIRELRGKIAELAEDDVPFGGRELVAVLQLQANTELRALFEAAARAGGPDGPGPDPAALAEAEATLDLLYTEAARHGFPHRQANARLLGARARFLAGRHQEEGDAFAEADRLITEAEQLVERAGAPWRLTQVHGQRGELALYTGDLATAERFLRKAADSAARYGDRSSSVARVHDGLGRAYLGLDRPAEAARAFTESAARYDRNGDAAEAVSARIMLGQVLCCSGRADDGVAVLESVLLEPEFTGLDVREQAQTRLNLARGLREIDEPRAAAEEYLLLADQVAGFEDRHIHTMVAAEAAAALAAAEQWPAADLARQRALDSHRTAPHPDAVFDMLLRQARHTAERYDPDHPEAADQALARLDEAAEVARTAEREQQDFGSGCPDGTLHDTRARTLSTLRRDEEALAEMERAIAAFAAHGPGAHHGRAESIRVAAVLEANRLDRRPAALARLDAAIAAFRAADAADAAEPLIELRAHLTRG